MSSDASTGNARIDNAESMGPVVAGDFPADEGRLWTTREMRVLRSHIQPYKETEKSSKGDYIRNTVIPQLQATWDHKYSRQARKEDRELNKEWKLKKDRIYNWFKNHASNKANVKLEGLNTRVTFQTVFREQKSAEIDAEIALLSGDAARGSKQWMKYYQQGRKQVEERLTEEERAKYVEIQEEWSKKGLSKTLKARTAKRQGKKILQQMDRIKWLKMGMRSITFEGHYNIEGKIEYSMTQTNDLGLDDTRIPSFGQLFPAELKAFRRAFVQYLVKVSEIEKGVASPAVPDGTFQEKALKFTRNGLPMVPNPIYNAQGRETTLVQKSIIRIYMNRIYALAKGKPGSKVPWDAVEKQAAELIDPEYWPDSVPVTDPSHLRMDNTSAVLKLWRERQSQGIVPFKFAMVLSSDQTDLLEPSYPSNLFEGLEPQSIPLPPAPKPNASRPRRRNIRAQYNSSSDSEESSNSSGNSISENALNVGGTPTETPPASEDNSTETPPASEDNSTEPPPIRRKRLSKKMAGKQQAKASIPGDTSTETPDSDGNSTEPPVRARKGQSAMKPNWKEFAENAGIPGVTSPKTSSDSGVTSTDNRRLTAAYTLGVTTERSAAPRKKPSAYTSGVTTERSAAPRKKPSADPLGVTTERSAAPRKKPSIARPDGSPPDSPSRSSEAMSLPTRSSPTVLNPSSTATPEVEDPKDTEHPARPKRKIMPRRIPPERLEHVQPAGRDRNPRILTSDALALREASLLVVPGKRIRKKTYKA